MGNESALVGDILGFAGITSVECSGVGGVERTVEKGNEVDQPPPPAR